MPVAEKERRIAVSQTPLRLGFGGGGSDIPAFFEEHPPGAVVSVAINRYVTVVAGRHFFPDEIRVSYSKTEDKLFSIEEMKHPTIRESMRLVGIGTGHQTTTVTDIPWQGTGMGSSSSCTVGVLNAFHELKGEHVSRLQLATEAVRVERKMVGDKGGLQDQYMAAYGGIQEMEFNKGWSVTMREIPITSEALRVLEKHVMLFYTGVERKSTDVHEDQEKKIAEHLDDYALLRQNGRDMARAIAPRLDVGEVGRLLDEDWTIKKRLANGVSNEQIDAWYERAKQAGALGGKITGAGGGGFLLVLAERERQPGIRKALPELRDITAEAPLELGVDGSRIVFSSY
ncbi:MAG TPA: hypothetical protein VL944_02200 [Candidatus Acidoferrum sp.]|nr:hypothetical protein [Candidatus Acidoferrum sp.]